MLIHSRQPNVNTQRLTGWFGIGDPILRGAGLAGLGDASNIFGTDTAATGGQSSPFDPATVTAVNSELVFGSNLFRAWAGQPPLNVAATAPAVNVGLTQDTQNLVLLGGAALLLVVLLKGKRKKRK